jgi:hypothetical protein
MVTMSIAMERVEAEDPAAFRSAIAHAHDPTRPLAGIATLDAYGITQRGTSPAMHERTRAAIATLYQAWEADRCTR